MAEEINVTRTYHPSTRHSLPDPHVPLAITTRLKTMPTLKHQPAYDLNAVFTLFKKIRQTCKCIALDCSCPLEGKYQVFAHVEAQTKARIYYAKLIGVHTGLFQPPLSRSISTSQWNAISDLEEGLKLLYPHRFSDLPSIFVTPQMKLLSAVA